MRSLFCFALALKAGLAQFAFCPFLEASFGREPEDETLQPDQVIEFSDLDAKSYSTAKLKPGHAFVLVFVTTDCPIANSYQPTLTQLSKDLQDRGFQFVLVHEGPNQSAQKLTKHATEYSVNFPVVSDPQHFLARLLGATCTPEAFVVNHRHETVYQGRIDDLPVAFGKKRHAPTRQDLRAALF